MLSSTDARASRRLMSMRADKLAISSMPHWLRIQKIPRRSFRNWQTWTRSATLFFSWGERGKWNFKQHNKVTGRPTICPQFFVLMDIVDKKKEQIKALIEKMKQEGKPIDWATAVLCWWSVRPAVNGRTVPCSTLISLSFRKCTSSVEHSCTDQVHLLQERQTRNDLLLLPRMIAKRTCSASEASPSVWSFAFIIPFHISSGLVIAASQVECSNKYVLL